MKIEIIGIVVMTQMEKVIVIEYQLKFAIQKLEACDLIKQK